MFLVVAMLFLSNGFFHYLVITFHVTTVSTTVRVNGTVQFTFFLVMKLNIIIVTSFDSLTRYFYKQLHWS